MTPSVKICGLTTPNGIEAAAGADFIGFVFYAGSPRNVTPEAAKALAARSSLPTVAVTVDANDTLLGMICEQFSPNYIQLHGNESPERIRQIKTLFGRPVIKALSIIDAADIERAHAYEHCVDRLMFDAKAPAEGLPGGNGIAFDWKILKGRTFQKPWFLSGGLTPENVVEAIRASGAQSVDVSSGVEARPGVKDPERVQAFIEKAKSVSL